MTSLAPTTPAAAASPAPASSAPTSSAPSFVAESWARTAALREQIHASPFLVELADGTLPRETFTGYLAQDAHYLTRYAAVLSAAASRAEDPDDVVFWAGSAARAVQVERLLHATHVADLTAAEPSPTCTAYTSWLLSVVAVGSYPEIAAAVLPCFRVYQEVGTQILATVTDLTDHPYADWISTYADPAFRESTEGAVRIVDRAAARAGERTVERMHDAVRQGVRYEWMFWDAAYRRETWPV